MYSNSISHDEGHFNKIVKRLISTALNTTGIKWEMSKPNRTKYQMNNKMVYYCTHVSNYRTMLHIRKDKKEI